MINRIGTFIILALFISVVAYGCTASGSVGTNKMQNQKTAVTK